MLPGRCFLCEWELTGAPRPDPPEIGSGFGLMACMNCAGTGVSQTHDQRRGHARQIGLAIAEAAQEAARKTLVAFWSAPMADEPRGEERS